MIQKDVDEKSKINVFFTESFVCWKGAEMIYPKNGLRVSCWIYMLY